MPGSWLRPRCLIAATVAWLLASLISARAVTPVKDFERIALLHTFLGGAVAATRHHIAAGARGEYRPGTVRLFDGDTFAHLTDVSLPPFIVQGYSATDGFGQSLAADDDAFLAGASRRGEIYRVAIDGSARRIASGSQEAQFGRSIAVSRGRLAVASPSVFGELAAGDVSHNLLSVLDARTGALVWEAKVPPTPFYPAVTALGQRVAISGSCPSLSEWALCVVVFDLRNGRRLLEIPAPPQPGGRLFGVALSFGKTLVVGAPVELDGVAYSFHAHTGRLLQTYRPDPPPLPSGYSFFGIHVLSGESWVAVTDAAADFRRGSVYLYDRRSGELIQRLDNRFDEYEYGADLARYGSGLLVANHTLTGGFGLVDVLAYRR